MKLHARRGDSLGGIAPETLVGVLPEWEARVRAIIPSAQRLDSSALLDNFPHFLTQLSELSGTACDEQRMAPLRESAVLHAENRARSPGYTLDAVLLEYHLLRDVLQERLTDELAACPGSGKTIHGGLDLGMRVSGSSFLAATERIVRGMERILDAALSHVDLNDLLRELLERIATFMGADTAVILLREDNHLIVRAARGLEEEVQRQVRVPIGKGFAGSIAAARSPVIIEDIDTAEIWSPYLKQQGIRSLMGAPLVVEGEVRGVLHVGSRTPRLFTDQELHLLQLAADRTALSIDRSRLVSELREADARKDEFIAVVGHELRTPLSAISNALYILENIQVNDARAQKQLQRAGRQTRQLARLCEDLLDVGRVVHGRLTLRLEKVDLTSLVADALESVRPLAESRGQDLRTALPDAPIWIQGDPDRLDQIFNNLLGNAVKYTGPGGDIAVTLDRREKEVVFEVQDSGVGIDPLMLPQIFDMFQQIDPQASRSEGGLGIGLALVKRLVEQHGGVISARSEGPDSGATFTVHLPLAHDSVDGTSNQRSGEAANRENERR